MAQIVQQRGDKEQLSVLRADCRDEALVGGQALQVLDRRAVDAERVLLPRVIGRRVDERHEPQLADLCEPTELGRIDQLPYTRRDRHINARRDAHQARGGAVEPADLGQVEQRVGHSTAS